MKLFELEKHLCRGEQWGFRKPTNSPEYLGWVLIAKRQLPTVWAKAAYDNDQSYSRAVEKHNDAQKTPYHVRVLELRRDIHESEGYESREDYRVSENYYFETLGEVKEFVESCGLTLEKVQSRSALDAP
jgi:hypothetical protein